MSHLSFRALTGAAIATALAALLVPVAAHGAQNTKLTAFQVSPRTVCDRNRAPDLGRLVTFTANSQTKVRIFHRGMAYGLVPYAGHVDQWAYQGVNRWWFGYPAAAPGADVITVSDDDLIWHESVGQIGLQALSDNGWLGGSIRWSGTLTSGSEEGTGQLNALGVWAPTFGC